MTDVILHALDTTWELHKPFLQKSSLLSAMVRRADQSGLKLISEEDEPMTTAVPRGRLCCNTSSFSGIYGEGGAECTTPFSWDANLIAACMHPNMTVVKSRVKVGLHAD